MKYRIIKVIGSYAKDIKYIIQCRVFCFWIKAASYMFESREEAEDILHEIKTEVQDYKRVEAGNVPNMENPPTPPPSRETIKKK